MNQLYYLSTCDTCRRIMREVCLPVGFPKQEIKSEPLTEKQLAHLRELAGSYEALFNRRSQLYRKRKLKEQELKEEDYKQLLLEHYTFLKRPVFVIEDELFVGNAKKTVAQVRLHLAELN